MRLPGASTVESDLPAGACTLRRINSEQQLWSRVFESPISRITRLEKTLHVLFQAGMYHALNIADGTLRSWAVASTLMNVSLAAHKDGAVTASVENKVTHHESDGFSLWQKRSKGQRGMTPPAWTAMLAQGNRLLLGDSQGEV
ncbi:MAG: hypothetical protein H8E15_03645 [Planctomycetes bacterium]|nr:hypothetical protein [Planctomycetota bacterium]